MKLTAEDYRRNYHGLSDEEFLAIDPDDLVDVARRCYDAELKRRQLESPGEGADEDPDEDSEAGTVREMPRIPTDEEFVQAALPTSTERAMYAQRILMDADIPCELDHNPTLPGIYAQGSIGLMVPASCVEIARELLAQNLTGDNQILVQRWLEKEWTPGGLDLKDFIVTIDDIFGDAGKVAARLTVHGIDPHTDKDVKSEGVAIVHVADGHITGHWVKLDL
jgi:hypothetical protein